MGEAASAIPARHHPGWPLRLSQQVLSAYLDGLQRHGRFRVGTLRERARASLVALPASGRRDAVRWLGWQLLGGVPADRGEFRAECHALVHGVDPSLVPLLHHPRGPRARADLHG